MNTLNITTSANYNGLPVYNGSKASDGFYVDILNRVYGVLNAQIKRHNKVLVIRFDLHFPKEMDVLQYNAAISQFYDRYTRKLKRNGADPKMIWVREQYRSQNPHYHCILTVDGNKHRAPHSLLALAAEHWERVTGVEQVDGLVDYCTQAGPGYYNLRRNDFDYPDVYGECFKRCSYLAKVNTKEGLPHEKHRYGGSRI